MEMEHSANMCNSNYFLVVFHLNYLSPEHNLKFELNLWSRVLVCLDPHTHTYHQVYTIRLSMTPDSIYQRRSVCGEFQSQI